MPLHHNLTSLYGGTGTLKMSGDGTQHTNTTVDIRSSKSSEIVAMLREAIEYLGAGSYTRTDEKVETDSEWWQNEAAAQQERAIKAEKNATYWENTSRAQTGALQRAQARADAAGSRPLTPDAMTAREHLDAAWEAAHVPVDGIIPEGRMFLDRGTAGVVVVGAAGKDLASRGSSWERRLVDPPTPARPEGAEELQCDLAAFEDTDQPHTGRARADYLAALGWTKERP